jgi:hypothetical protein
MASGCALGNIAVTDDFLSAMAASTCGDSFFTTSTNQWPAAVGTSDSKPPVLAAGEPERQWNRPCKQQHTDQC